MNSFKILLEDLEEDTKRSVWQRRNRFTKKELDTYLEGKNIQHQKFVILLGDWAIEKWKESNDRGSLTERALLEKGYKPYNEMGAMQTTFNSAIGRMDVYRGIAVACLGEKRVKERLSVSIETDKEAK